MLNLQKKRMHYNVSGFERIWNYLTMTNAIQPKIKFRIYLVYKLNA